VLFSVPLVLVTFSRTLALAAGIGRCWSSTLAIFTASRVVIPGISAGGRGPGGRASPSAAPGQGAARYRARLNLRSEEPRADDTLEATSRVYSGAPAGTRAYWSAEWRERREWIQRIEKSLEERCWPSRADAGWSDFDLEISGSRWASVALATVVEANHDRSQTLRCRLHRRWTLTSQALFWGVLALVVLIIGVFHVDWRGWWIPLATQGAIAWFLHRQGHKLQCRIGVLLDEVAREWKSSQSKRELRIDTSSSPRVISTHSTSVSVPGRRIARRGPCLRR
jgi:hypothetical protein